MTDEGPARKRMNKEGNITGCNINKIMAWLSTRRVGLKQVKMGGLKFKTELSFWLKK